MSNTKLRTALIKEAINSPGFSLLNLKINSHISEEEKKYYINSLSDDHVKLALSLIVDRVSVSTEDIESLSSNFAVDINKLEKILEVVDKKLLSFFQNYLIGKYTSKENNTSRANSSSSEIDELIVSHVQKLESVLVKTLKEDKVHYIVKREEIIRLWEEHFNSMAFKKFFDLLIKKEILIKFNEGYLTIVGDNEVYVYLNKDKLLTKKSG